MKIEKATFGERRRMPKGWAEGASRGYRRWSYDSTTGATKPLDPESKRKELDKKLNERKKGQYDGLIEEIRLRRERLKRKRG